ncbi:MAG: glycoside hydrolase family 16 protein, partial [Kiritimatiellae bacterium]|nr:glycoside hydrolase family 16 protein [Kiritimatiellia bacterium]
GNISQVKIFFAGKNDKAARKAVWKGLCAAGAKGEKPLASPGSIVVVPKDGVLLPAKGLTAENFNCWVGSSATPKKDGTVKVAFSEKAGCAVRYKLPAGVWNLGDWLKVEATVRNTSDRAIVPVVKVDSKGGAAAMEGETVLKPKETKTIEVVFIPKVPWEAGEDNKTKPGTEWKFESHRVTGILFQVKDNKAGDSYEVLNVTAKKVIAKKPKWLGKHPPVKGDWTLTLNENFDGKAIDANVWTNGWDNYWDQRTHFSKDNLFLRDGCMVLKYEKKRGHHLDDENGKVTDYQCGYAATYGRFTQKYGYFEARMKLPEAPGLWPAFWTMPDRGGSGPHWIRSDTWKGGMEFDIMEHLTAWGPHRFNMAFHWDGYDKFHKSIGTSGAYVPADEEGFMTIGMLWLPGEVVYFGNGRPIGVWKSPRVSDVPAYLIFYMVSGGWANVPIEDDKLPAEFIVDYVRVWQRKDLAK